MNTHAAPGSLNQLLGADAARPWYRRPTPWLVLAVLALAAGAFGWWEQGKGAAAAPQYSTEPVTRGRLAVTVTATGTLQPTIPEVLLQIQLQLLFKGRQGLRQIENFMVERRLGGVDDKPVGAEQWQVGF